jgi:hypothetical protein
MIGMTRKPKPDNPEQFKRFGEAAHELAFAAATRGSNVDPITDDKGPLLCPHYLDRQGLIGFDGPLLSDSSKMVGPTAIRRVV